MFVTNQPDLSAWAAVTGAVAGTDVNQALYNMDLLNDKSYHRLDY